MRGFARAGYLDPNRLVFAHTHVARVRDVAEQRVEQFETLDDAYAQIHRDHPMQESPEFIGALRTLINRQDFASALEPE